MSGKYKVLLTSGSTVVEDMFFTHMSDELELMSSSGRFTDLENHMKYCHPDLFVFGLNHETRPYMYRFEEFREKYLKRENIPLAIIGTDEECDEYTDVADDVDLIVSKSQSSSKMVQQILKFLDGRAAIEAQKRMQEELEKEKEREVLASLEAEKIQEEEKAKAEEKAKEEKKAAEKEEDANRRKHILVIDDDPLMLKSIKKRLEEDYDVATAISGKLAMRFLEKKTTDMIFLDYEMPQEDGPAVLEKLREMDKAKDIPVVFLTGVADRERIQEALSMKPQGYLLKPIDHNKLTAIINKVIG